MIRLSALMTAFEESEFIDYAIRSCIDHVDDLVIVEGAYKQTIRLGKSPRSMDGTIEIIEKYRNHPKVHIIYANEESDPQQRNVGLDKIKEINPNGWMIIVDGDEVYDPNTFTIIKNQVRLLEITDKYAAYFTSLTFVNDLSHFTYQEFPRLFKITPKCKFENDNFLYWEDKGLSRAPPLVTKLPQIKFWHMAFCKKPERFKLKKKWWETRFDKEFNYSWTIDENGKISDKNHSIYPYTGRYPDVLKEYLEKKNEA